ncbi:bifunctional enoyl-CoA hydratase/phosphate acetyltransferase [Marinicauda pacifica]|uniref:bifunctional enoyl-CoA hydratase/phosphate acetyltransferase n=1 Tax=Marinicauda pacifica TaxID=1133559 RepID=UPI0035C7B64B
MTREAMDGLTLDQIDPGMRAKRSHTVSHQDLRLYSSASGDLNPLHLPELDGDGDGKTEAICPAAYLAALVSGLIGTELPGPGSRETAWSIRLGEPVRMGETVTIELEAEEKDESVLTLKGRITGPSGMALDARVSVIPPRQARSFGRAEVSALLERRHDKFAALVAACEALDPVVTAVVCPYSDDALEGAVTAAKKGLITPILVGNRNKIAAAAKSTGCDIEGIEIVEAEGEEDAARTACRLVAEDKAGSVMKGHLHTETFLKAILSSSTGLKGERRVSHVFVLDTPGLDHLLLVTDAAVNIAPSLAAKRDIVQNAIDLARALGIGEPRAAILSAVETVNPALASTIDAAALSKMAERGQITGGLVDGPFALDNAVNLQAAKVKNISGEVAGRAQILVGPNIEAANMLAKELSFVGRAESAGVVLGTRVPVILTSRADSEFSRLVSCAVAALHRHWLKTGEPVEALKQG